MSLPPKSPRGRSAALVALCCVALLSLAAACKGKGDADDAAGPGGAKNAAHSALPVIVTNPQLGDISKEIVSSTNLVSRQSVEVVAETVGIVHKIGVEAGDAVTAGQRLCELDHAPARLALQAAKLSLDKAQSELDRVAPLAKEGYASQKVLEDAGFALRRAENNLRRAREEVTNQRVNATIEGTVTARHAVEGRYVTPGTPLFSLAELEHIEANVKVPERYLPQLRPGQIARITAEALPDALLAGKVQRISPVVDPRSGTVTVTVLVESPTTHAGEPTLGPHARPGMFVSVRLVVDTHRGTPLIPKAAVLYEEGRPVIYTATAEGKAQRRVPELGYDDGRRVELLTPLDAGERLVVQGQDSLKDGVAVRVVGERPAFEVAGRAAPANAAPH